MCTILHPAPSNNVEWLNMANSTPCQTPGAQFHTKISPKKIECSVDLPMKLELTVEEAELLETKLHNALELVLARNFNDTK